MKSNQNALGETIIPLHGTVEQTQSLFYEMFWEEKFSKSYLYFSLQEINLLD